MLKVSFEIKSGVCAFDGDVVVVEANEANQLVGMAVVSVPAYPDASSAVLMVAEAESEAENGNEAPASEAKMQEGEEMEEKMIDTEAPVTEDEKKEEIPAVPENDSKAEDNTEASSEAAAAEAAEDISEPEQTEQEDAPEAEQLPAIDVAALMQTIEALKMQVEDLMPYKQMAEADAQAKEKSVIDSFIQKAALSKEDERVCAAAEALDYKSLVEMWVSAPECPCEPAMVQAAAFTQMQPQDIRSWLYSNK